MESTQQSADVAGLLTKLASIAGRVPALTKSVTDKGQAFVDADDVDRAVNPLLAEMGVVIWPTAIQDTTEIIRTLKGNELRLLTMRVTYSICDAETGARLEAVCHGEATDTNDAACSKALHRARKALYCDLFGLVVGGSSAQQPSRQPQQSSGQARPARPRAGGVGRGPSEGQIKYCHDLLSRTGHQLTEFLERYQAATINDLSKQQISDIIAELNAQQ